VPEWQAVAQRWAERWWPAAGLLALAALWWSCRGALFGVPTADDYEYLYRLTFQRPLEWFDSMGAPFYWRPLTRQGYYAALGPWMLRAPWMVSAVHGLLLAALYVALYRIVRRGYPAWVAMLAAAAPLLSEPARVLLVWPTGSQYLVPMAAAAWAVHEALAGRMAGAGLAALAALLSHEAAVVVLPVVALVGWARDRSRAAAARWGALAAGVGALWLAGRLVAQAHGVAWLAATAGGRSWLGNGGLALWRSLAAQLNLEDMDAAYRGVVLALYAALALLALGLAIADRRVRSRLARHRAGLAVAAVWFALGVAPLALLLPDWESWRTSLAALWLGAAVVCGLALVRGWLAWGWTAVRLAALLLAAPAPGLVAQVAPPATSGISLAHVVRWQRIADSTHRALLARYPTLPRGARIDYWTRLPMSEVALAVPKAFRVWYADSTIRWGWYWQGGVEQQRPGAMVAYDTDSARPAVVIEPRAVELWDQAEAEMAARNLPRTDSLLAEAYRVQSVRPSGEFASWVLANRARLAYARRDFRTAESFNEESFREAGATPEYLVTGAMLALAKKDRALARDLLARALEIEPTNETGLRVLHALDAPPPATAPR
jgi:hypothetical protein